MKRSVLAAALCAVLALSACSDDGGGEEEPKRGGPAVVELPSSKASLLVGGPVDAADRGEVRFEGKPVTVNGCLGAASGDRTFLVVWPDSTALDSVEGDSLDFDGQVLDPDGTFVGTGTLVYRQPFPEQFPDIPIRCLGPNQEPVVWLQEIDSVSE